MKGVYSKIVGVSAYRQPVSESLEIPWPTEVTEADMVRIAAYRQQGRSLGGSVASAILDETQELINPLFDKRMRFLERCARSGRINTILDGYTQPAGFLLRMEEYIRSGEPRDPEQLDILNRKVAEFVAETVPRSEHRIDKTTEDCWEIDEELGRREAIIKANLIIGYGRLIKKLKQMTVLQFVDYCTAQAFEYLAKLEFESANRWSIPLRRQALEHGRQRFHQLYNAAFQAGL